MQWNCRGLRAEWEEVSDLIARLYPVCLCIQETMVGDFTLVCPPGYHTFYSDPLHDQGHHGGCAIFVRRDVPFSYRRLATPFQAVAVQI